MKNQFLVRFMLALTAASSLIGGQLPVAASETAPASSGKVKYQCIKQGSVNRTVAQTSRGPIELIVWRSDFFSGSGWSPERRCHEVTQRFQEHSDKKNFKYISTGTLNNYPVICVSEQSGKCRADGLLITLQPSDDPNKVLSDLFNLAARASAGGITRTEGDFAIKEIIDLDRFLRESPVMNNASVNPTRSEPTNNSPSNTTSPNVITNPLEDL